MPRVMVLGLDCVPAALAFGSLAHTMPNLARLAERGAHGPLRSTTPPITVPAWTCMFSGRDPGEVGLYGFRSRSRGSYDLTLPDARSVKVKRAWDWLGETGHRVAVLFVPPGHPPTPVRGVSASCFLYPADGSPWTYPPELGAKLEATHGAYRADVAGFRGRSDADLAGEISAMTAQHFAIARGVWARENPDALFMVDIGPDRFHHAFYRHLDPAHPRHDANHPMVATALAYYRSLDAEVGRTVDAAGPDTNVIVASDHGARPLLGGVRVNQLLIESGWLTLKGEPAPNASILPEHIEWSRTRAFAEGGYYARVCLNLAGREPEGIVKPGDADACLRELEALFAAVPIRHDGVAPHRIVRPDREYRVTRGLAPDLMVFFGDLAYRALGTLDGRGGLWDEANDRGTDDANHDWNGIFVAAGPSVTARGALEDLAIYDVASTVLGVMGVAAPKDLLGRDRSRP